MKKYNTSETEPALERLRMRGIDSSETLEDPYLLEWIMKVSDLIFVDATPVLCKIAENPNINLRTALTLSSNPHAEVRKALLDNPKVHTGVLYGLAFDSEKEIRAAAEQHPNLHSVMLKTVQRVKTRHYSLLKTETQKGRSILLSYGVIVADEAVNDFYVRNALLQEAYKEPAYWTHFAISSGYTIWHLKSLTEKVMKVSLSGR